MALDPNERAIIERLEDALQIALLLVARLAPDVRQSAEDASQILNALTRAVEAVKQLQLVEHDDRAGAGRRRQAKANLTTTKEPAQRGSGKKPQ